MTEARRLQQRIDHLQQQLAVVRDIANVAGSFVFDGPRSKICALPDGVEAYTPREQSPPDPRADGARHSWFGDGDLRDRDAARGTTEGVVEQMSAATAAFDTRDLQRLRVAAHMLAATLGAFSTTVGVSASALEEAAIESDIDAAATIMHRLETMVAALVDDTRGLTLDSLGS